MLLPSKFNNKNLRWPRRAIHLFCFGLALTLIWLLATRRFVDFSDEGFYLTNAWLAYSGLGQLPVSHLLLNFGFVLGLPYLVFENPPIVMFRVVSLLSWYAVHLLFLHVVSRNIRADVNPIILHALAFASLFVFLIPMLSYQNLPYMFCLLSVSLLLTSAEARFPVWADHALRLLSPVPLGLALISSTGFIVPLAIVCVALAGWMIVRRRFDMWIAAGTMIAAILVIDVFRGMTLESARAAFLFFNSEVVYTSATRLGAKLQDIFTGSASAIAVGTTLFVALRVLRRAGMSSPLLFGTLAWLLYSLLETGAAHPQVCQATCDEFVLALIRCSLVASAVVLEDLVSQSSSQYRWLALCVIGLLLLQLYVGVASNAPLQYNLKYYSPVPWGVLILLNARRTGSGQRLDKVGMVLLVLCVLLPCAWITVRSNYGRGSIGQAHVDLILSDFRFLKADQTRRNLLVSLNEIYEKEGCASRYFAAVDSLMLGYFIFKRKPPFPHAWVATRVASSRDSIVSQRDGCILMQDRLLPGTPEDASTMIGYLKLRSDDQSSVHGLGENMYLISFTRAEQGEEK